MRNTHPKKRIAGAGVSFVILGPLTPPESIGMRCVQKRGNQIIDKIKAKPIAAGQASTPNLHMARTISKATMTSDTIFSRFTDRILNKCSLLP